MDTLRLVGDTPAAARVGAAGHCSVRVRYSEIDAMAVAHHTRHVAWFEVGRTEWMRAAGAAYAEVEAAGISFPVIDLRVQYRAPAHYDDVLDIETRVAAHSGARLTFGYTIRRRADGEVVATGESRHAAVDRSFRPCRLPSRLRHLLDSPGPLPALQEPC